MGKISDNSGVYMTLISSDMIISKKTSQLLLTIPMEIYRTICQNKARPNLTFKLMLKKISQCSFSMLDGKVKYLK